MTNDVFQKRRPISVPNVALSARGKKNHWITYFALSTGFDLMELIISMGGDLLGDSGFLLPNALKEESKIVVVGLCSLFNILVHWLEAML